MSVQQATEVLYISRLIPNLRDHDARRKLGNPSELYGFLLQAFEGKEIVHHHEKKSDSERGVLYRIEASLDGRMTSVLIQSTQQPDWSFMNNHQGFLLQNREPEWKAFSIQPTAGTVYRFRLRANPTKSTSSGPKPSSGTWKRGKPKPIYAENEQRDWLLRKLEGAAKVSDMRVIPEATINTKHQNKQYATLCSALFEGELRVREPEELTRLVRQGIGRGRGLGFGLLSLARVTPQ